MEPAGPTYGMVAPDGSPVELYQLLPPDGEPEIIDAALPAGGAILELGCGTGRVTRPLRALGHPVVGVDQSAAMLAHVHDAETVLADIETLDLGRTFAGVVLGSYLINTPDDARRAAFLRTCRRHVAADGLVLVERHDPDWAAALVPGAGERDGISFAIRDVRHTGRLFSAVIEYGLWGRSWEHAFTARILDDKELTEALASAGLLFAGRLDATGRWIAARPA